jgi:hypothetical protein
LYGIQKTTIFFKNVTLATYDRYNPVVDFLHTINGSLKMFDIPHNKIGYAMQQLSSKQREVLILITIKGLTYKDAALAMEMSVIEARRLLTEARETLQIILDTPVLAPKKGSFIPPYQKALSGNALYAA